jgi:hypothetical protein
VRTHFQRPDHLHHEGPLPVVTTLFNAARWRTRWKHYEDFARRVDQAGGLLYTVEVAFGDRAFVLEPGERIIQFRTDTELWLKENAINVGVQFVTADNPQWTKVAWVDADMRFARDDWADETKHRLEHYDIVQMWSQYVDVDANYELVNKPIPSFIGVYASGKPRKEVKMHGYRYGYPGAPGLAWACTRHAWDTFGGLLDVTILGAGDWYMAHALVDELSVDPRNHPAYVKAIKGWRDRALLLRKNVGVVPGLALHYWHGPKALRKYGTRETILIDEQYDPTAHLTKNAAGLWEFNQFTPITLRDRVRNYLHERNEDA